MTSCSCNYRDRCDGTGWVACRGWECFCSCGCEDEECLGCADCDEPDGNREWDAA